MRYVKALVPAVLAGCLALAAGCGAAPSPTPEPTATPLPIASPAPERPLPAEPRSSEDLPAQLIEKARADLVARFGIASAGITGAAVTQPVVLAENLGCPLSSAQAAGGKKLSAGDPGTVTVYEVRLVTAGAVHVYRINGDTMVYCGSQ